MVKQYVGQGRDVGQQGFHRACGQLGEGVVGGGEYGERAIALQRLRQTRCTQCRHQGSEPAVAYGDVHDGSQFLRREQNRVDDMDNPVRGLDVCDDNLGVVDAHGAAVDSNGHGITLHGVGRVQGCHVGGHHCAGHHVVEQYVGQGRDVGQEGLHRACGQLGECVVGGSEDRERAISL